MVTDITLSAVKLFCKRASTRVAQLAMRAYVTRIPMKTPLNNAGIVNFSN